MEEVPLSMLIAEGSTTIVLAEAARDSAILTTHFFGYTETGRFYQRRSRLCKKIVLVDP